MGESLGDWVAQRPWPRGTASAGHGVVRGKHRFLSFTFSLLLLLLLIRFKRSVLVHVSSDEEDTGRALGCFAVAHGLVFASVPMISLEQKVFWNT